MTDQATFTIAIMAHPARETQARLLSAHLPTAVVVWDEKNDRWDTGRRALMAHHPAARWHLVVQDDAVLCDHFVNQVAAALGFVDDGPVAFYLGSTGRNPALTVDLLHESRALGRCWIRGPGPYWGVAVAVRVEDVAPAVAWGDIHPEVLNYDRRLAAYFASVGRSCWYSIPSLVDHAKGPSLIPGRTGTGRRALYAPRRIRGHWTGRVAEALRVKDPTPASLRHTLGGS